MNQGMVVVLGVLAFVLVAVVLVTAVSVVALYTASPKSDPWPPGVRRPTSCELARDLAARGPVQNQSERVWKRELDRLESQCKDEIKRGTPPAPTLTPAVP